MKLSLPLESREGGAQEPTATRTRLGWSVCGTTINSNSSFRSFSSYHICECSSDANLHDMMKQFFSTESFGVKKPDSIPESKEDQRARILLETTTKRVGSKFETGLLWKFDKVSLPDSFPMALRRLDCLQKKMEKDIKFSEEMHAKIRDYEAKGYVRKLTEDELRRHSARIWYLPVFAVTNKPGKFRMVFDAAAEVKGFSLNSVLLKGPDQVTPLPVVLFRFRERRIQRFLWRDAGKKEPDEFVMQVMTFGSACSPSSAQFVKNKNAREYAETHPKAAHAIVESHYVDDWLDSVDTEEEAIKLAVDVKFVHHQGGFEIRNFVSNSPTVFAVMNGKPTDVSRKNLNVSPEIDNEKVLGMWWNTAADTFTYSLIYNKTNVEVLSGRRTPTKRDVLRTLMSIFDPLGLLTFFLVFVKILLQEIWRSAIDWDQEINEEQLRKWSKWVAILPKVETLQVPRCYSLNLSSKNLRSTQLHIFVDASENAFAANGYFRVESEGKVECVLVGSKGRVAPTKPMTIPRLELQAAVLGVRLANTIVDSHLVKIDRRFFWSDSKTVLYWLKSDPRKFRQFVSFRIGENQVE